MCIMLESVGSGVRTLACADPFSPGRLTTGLVMCTLFCLDRISGVVALTGGGAAAYISVTSLSPLSCELSEHVFAPRACMRG